MTLIEDNLFPNFLYESKCLQIKSGGLEQKGEILVLILPWTEVAGRSPRGSGDFDGPYKNRYLPYTSVELGLVWKDPTHSRSPLGTSCV